MSRESRKGFFICAPDLSWCQQEAAPHLVVKERSRVPLRCSDMNWRRDTRVLHIHRFTKSSSLLHRDEKVSGRDGPASRSPYLYYQVNQRHEQWDSLILMLIHSLPVTSWRPPSRERRHRTSTTPNKTWIQNKNRFLFGLTQLAWTTNTCVLISLIMLQPKPTM